MGVHNNWPTGKGSKGSPLVRAPTFTIQPPGVNVAGTPATDKPRQADWGRHTDEAEASGNLDPDADVPEWARREPRTPLNQCHIVDLVRLNWLAVSAAYDAIIHELRTGYATTMMVYVGAAKCSALDAHPALRYGVAPSLLDIQHLPR